MDQQAMLDARKAFDPYHKWLGIPPSEQPPNHYRLLGAAIFEADLDVIASAADRQMAHLRTFQSGQHSADSQKLLNEVSAARVCLSRPAEKAIYDAQLRRRLQPAEASPSQAAPPQPLPVPMAPTSPRPLPVAPSVRWAQPMMAPMTSQTMVAPLQVRTPLVVEPRVVIDNRITSGRSRKYRRRSSGWPMAGVVTLAGAVFVGYVIWKAHQERSRPRGPETAERPLEEDPQGLDQEPLEANGSIDDRDGVTDAGTSDGAAKDESDPESLLDSPNGNLQPTALPPAELELAPTSDPPIVPTPLPDAQERLAVPSTGDLQQARKTVTARYGAELTQARPPLEAVELARKLIDGSRKAEDDAPLRYALLETASDVAAQAGAAEAAISAIEHMAEWFVVDDEVALKLATLTAAAKAPLNTRTKGEQLKAARELIDEAVDWDRYDDAKKAIALAEAAANALDDDESKKRIGDSRAEVEKLGKAYKTARGSLAKLEITPDDPDANLKVGRFYCLTKGDWDRGLPYLAKGGEGKIQDLARRERENPASAADQVALGDAWLAASRTAGTIKPALASRAAHWYRQAQTQLPAEDRPAVEERLKQIDSPPAKGRALKQRGKNAVEKVPPVDLLKLINVQAAGTNGAWRMENQALIAPQQAWASIGIPFVPPKEYRLKIFVGCVRHDGPFEVGLVVGGRQVVLAIDANGKTIKKVSGLADINGRGPNDSGMGMPGLYLGNGAVNGIECVVRGSSVQVWCNGIGIVNWTGDPQALSLPRFFAGRHAGQLFIGVGGTPSPFFVTKIELTPLKTGK